MTRHERLTLGVSVAALVISICSPLVNYYCFKAKFAYGNSKAKAFMLIRPCTFVRIRRRWFMRSTSTIPVCGQSNECILTLQKRFETINFDNKPYKPGAGLKFVFDKKNIKPDPPIDISVQEKADYLIVNFKDSLPHPN